MENTVEAKTRIQCREIMTRNVITVTRETNVRTVAKMMRDDDLGTLPIVDSESKLIGIVTDRDIVVRAVAGEKDLDKTEVGEIMTTKVHTAKSNDFAFQVVRLMGEEQVRRIPIVSDEGMLEGIVSMADIALEVEDEREIAEALEDISSGTGFWSKK